jgi:L-ascorbate metabolism protein UlaG (beta-lactamase superfamily)
MLNAKIAEVLGRLRWFGRSAFLIEDRYKIYVDPFEMPEGLPEADIVLISHNHPEHCSVPDVTKISKIQTIVVGPADCACRFRLNQLALTAGQSIPVLGVPVKGTPARAARGEQQSRAAGIGFIWEVAGVRIFHAGNSGVIPELEFLEADIVLLPVSENLMPPNEAAALAKRMKAAAALPMGFDPKSASQAEAFAAAARAAGLESFVPQRAILSPR